MEKGHHVLYMYTTCRGVCYLRFNILKIRSLSQIDCWCLWTYDPKTEQKAEGKNNKSVHTCCKWLAQLSSKREVQKGQQQERESVHCSYVGDKKGEYGEGNPLWIPQTGKRDTKRGFLEAQNEWIYAVLQLPWGAFVAETHSIKGGSFEGIN